MKNNQCAIVSTPNSDGQLHLPIPEAGEIQESTHQVPCGSYSIFDTDMLVPEFCRAVYLVINKYSNWDTGKSHPLSNRKIARLLGVKYASQANRAIKWLIDNGWLKVNGKSRDGTHYYQVIHHKCQIEDTPLDKDGRPQKCAVPSGKGAAPELVASGQIGWRVMVDWYVKKVHSDWVSGIIEMTVNEATDLMRFDRQTICNNAKEMCEAGLLHRLSPQYRASVFQFYPMPYPERKERQEAKGRKPLPLINDWYYSYNKLWKFHRNTLRLMSKDLDGLWHDTNMSALYEINPKIHADFREYIHITTITNELANNLRQ